MTNSFDTFERRCPRLGSIVSFAYCRGCEAEHRPCFKILDCWWERFDVHSVMRQTLTAEAYERLVHPEPPNKVGGLLELIEQARRRIASDQ
jgi:hypothetical protein